MENRENITFGHLKMFFLGSVVGAGVALLFAPKSGKEVREDIKEHYGKVRESAAENWQQFSTKAGENWQAVSKKGKEVADKVASKGRQVAEKVTTGSKDAYKKSTEAIGNRKDRIGAAINAGKTAAKEAYKKEDVAKEPVSEKS